MEVSTASAALPPPNGFLSAKIDEKGRLKLPSKIEEYFRSLKVESVFITSLDRNTFRVYSPSAWQATRIFLSQNRDDRLRARRILFAANDVGGDSDIDAQGRVLIPQKLRALMSLENQTVQMECLNEIVDIYTETGYAASLGLSVSDLPGDVGFMQDRGLP